MSLLQSRFGATAVTKYARNTAQSIVEGVDTGRTIQLSSDNTTGAAGEYYVPFSVGTGGTTYNLTDGTLKDRNGASVVVAKLVAVYIDKDDPSAAGVLLIGGGTNAVPFSGQADPHFTFAVQAGMTITASSNDRLKIASSAGTIVGNLVFVFRT